MLKNKKSSIFSKLFSSILQFSCILFFPIKIELVNKNVNFYFPYFIYLLDSVIDENAHKMNRVAILSPIHLTIIFCLLKQTLLKSRIKPGLWMFKFTSILRLLS